MPESCTFGQQNKPDPVAICELPFDLTVKNDQLLAQESIFNQQVGFASG
jgi:hypothetical protein